MYDNQLIAEFFWDLASVNAVQAMSDELAATTLVSSYLQVDRSTPMI
jgi:hypothetical protein